MSAISVVGGLLDVRGCNSQSSETLGNHTIESNVHTHIMFVTYTEIEFHDICKINYIRVQMEDAMEGLVYIVASLYTTHHAGRCSALEDT